MSVEKMNDPSEPNSINNSDSNSEEDNEFYTEDGKRHKKTNIMRKYEKETGKYAIWRGNVTEGFKKWQKGEKVYDRDKERISLYVSEETKNEWQEFIKKHNYSTVSKLIREAVSSFIDQKSRVISGDKFRLDQDALTNISHALKEPLTSIKGYSQLLLESEEIPLKDEIKQTIKNIFESSILLEQKIIGILDKISTESTITEILLIEDDLSTIRLLTSYFESKGYSCKGVISGTKAIEELKVSRPKIILLDIILPDVNGYDLSKMIKMDKELKDIPIYLLTAIPGSEVEKNIEDCKADGYILKPFDFSDFEILFEYLNSEEKA